MRREVWSDPVSATWSPGERAYVPLLAELADREHLSARTSTSLLALHDRLRLSERSRCLNGGPREEPEPPDPEVQDERRERAIRARLPFSGMDAARVERLDAENTPESRYTAEQMRAWQSEARARIEREGLEKGL